MKKGLLLFFAVISCLAAWSQMTVSSGAPAATLMSALAGSGLQITNVTINCANNAYGTFSNGAASGMGITNGIALTTGNLNTLPGAGNSNDDWTTNYGTTANDPQLTTVLGGAAQHDACIIEFDVVPACNNINLVFVFGSDEYTNWVNANFNDGFGFFVSGPNPAGGNYTNYNVAQLPNGTVVSIDNVNQNTNSGFFVNNNGGANANHFDGFTSVLTPAFNVVPCATYHFKLAIADATDGLMDSGVMIDIIQCSAPLTATISQTNATCTTNGSATATVTGGLGPYTYSWSPIGGNGPTASNLPPGTYTITVDDAIPCQTPLTQTVTITSNATPPTMTAPANQTVCNGATVTIPSFTSNPAGATFAWSSSNPAIGMAASGNGDIPAFTAVNNGGAPVSSTITVTPTLNGCTGNPVSFTITVNPTVTPTFTNPGPLCSGTAFTLPTTSTNGINGTWSPAVNNTTTTTYTFTSNAGQCAVNQTMTVVINPMITPTFTNPGPLCSGTSFTLPATSNNGINGNWSPAVNNTATTTYTFTPSAGQCATTTTMTVTINAPVTPTFANPGPLCSGTAFSLPTTSNNGYTGSWSPAVNNTATTTYTFTPNAGQCATNATMTVTINPQITPTFTNPGPICSGTAFTLPATSNNGYTGTWSPAVNNTATTTYTFTPTAGQCATTTTMTVAITPQTVPTFTQLGPYCQQDTPAALPGNSNNGINGSWTPAVISTANAGTSTYTFNPAAGQCATQSTMNITVNAPVTATFTQIQPFCEGFAPPALPATSNNGFSGTWNPSVIDNQNPGTYNFTPTAGQCATGTSMNISLIPRALPTFQPQPSYCQGSTVTAIPDVSNNGYSGSWSPAWTNQTTTTYTFTPNANECANPTQATITIIQPTTPNFATPAAYCYGTTAPVMSNTSPNGVAGTWSPAIVSNTASGTYTFTPNAGECAVPQSISTTVNPLPVFNVISNGPLCVGSTLNLSCNTNGASYSWSGPMSFGSNNAAPAIQNVTMSHAGTYSLFMTDQNGCSATYSTNVVVDNFLTPTLDPIGPFCASENAPQALTANYPNGTWSGAGVSGNEFNPSLAGAGTHTITYTHTVSCGGTNSMDIVVIPNPPATFTGDLLEGCAPITVTFSSDPTASQTSWDFGDGGTSNDIGTTTHTFSTPGTYTVSVTMTVNGCPGNSTNLNYIEVYPNPLASFAADHPEVTQSNPVISFTNNSVNADMSNWTFGDGTSSSVENPTHTYPEDVSDYVVTLAVSTIHGCVDTARMNVRVKPELIIYVPNVFTPDGDEFNNTFYPVISGDYDRENFTLYIFNRWGEMIFESHNDQIGWDGTYHDEYVQEGVYTWTIKVKHKYDDKYETFVGSVAILR